MGVERVMNRALETQTTVSAGVVAITLVIGLAIAMVCGNAIAQSGDEVVSPTDSDTGAAATSSPRPRRLGDSLNVDNSQEWRPGRPSPARANSGLSLLEEQLQQARTALTQGRIMAPQDGALAMFRKVLALDPENAAAARGIADSANALAVRMGSVYASGDREAATVELGHLRSVDPTHKAIEEMSAQLLSDHQIELLAAAARKAQDQENLTGPDGAAELYAELLAVSPDSQVAVQGLQQVESQLILQAQKLSDQQSFARASELLDKAAQVRGDPEDAVVTQQVSIAGARRAFINAQLSDVAELIGAGRFDQAQILLAQVSDREPGSDFTPAIVQLENDISQGRLALAYVPGTRLSDSLKVQSPQLIVVPRGSLGSPALDSARAGPSAQNSSKRLEFPVPFTLSETEITVGQFRAFVEATDYVTDAEKAGQSMVFDEVAGATKMQRGVNWKSDFQGRKAKSTLPVVHVSWNDAVAYTRWLSEQSGETYRLPTSAEFEYALRGGTQSTFWWGDEAPDSTVENLTGDRDRLNNLRWPEAFERYGDGHWGPAPVSEFQANAFQLFDLGGNVSEWVSDCHQGDANDGAANSSSEGCSLRAVRGASWATPPNEASSDYRAAAKASMASCLVGFRVVKELWSGPKGNSA